MDREFVWLDLDGVLANIARPIIQIFNEIHGTAHTEDDIKHWSFQDIFPSSAAFYDFFNHHSDRIYGEAVPYEAYPGESMDSKAFLEAVRRLCEAHKDRFFLIYFSSFVHPTDAARKMAFLRKHYDSKIAEQLLCGNSKSRLFQRGNIVIDDGPKVLSSAAVVGAIPVCIKRPWNSPDSNPPWAGPHHTFEQALRRLEELIK